MDPYRQTGRTTKMLVEAIRAADKGERVHIVAANLQSVNHIENRLRQLLDTTDRRPLGILVYPMGVLGDRINWETGQIRGFSQSSNSRILFDHYALESHYVQQKRSII